MSGDTSRYVREIISPLGHNGQFSAGIVILSEDLRYAQIIRERPVLWWNIAALPRFST